MSPPATKVLRPLSASPSLYLLPDVPRCLLTGPPASGKTWQALEAVRRVARQDEAGAHGHAATAPGRALLLVPTYAERMHVQRVALTHWGARGLFDDVFATFTSVGERFFPGFRVGNLPGRATRDRLLLAAIDEAGDKRFRALRGSPAFRTRLGRWIKEWKQSGIESSELLARLRARLDALDDAPRSRVEAALAVFEAYEQGLAEAGCNDHEDALRVLVGRLRAGDLPRRVTMPELLVVDGFDDLTQLQKNLLDALIACVSGAGGRIVVTCTHDPARPALFEVSETLRAHLMAHGFRHTALDGAHVPAAPPLRRIAAGLFAPGGQDEAQPPLAGGTSVQCIVGGDDEDEAQLLATAIHHAVAAPLQGAADGPVRSLRWHDVAIFLRDASHDGPRFEDALQRQGIPARLVVPKALAQTGLGRALRGALAVIETGGASDAGYDAHRTHAWLLWCALTYPAADREGALHRLDALHMRHRRYGAPSRWAGHLRALRGICADDGAGAGMLRATLDALASCRTDVAQVQREVDVYVCLREHMELLAPVPAACSRGGPQAHAARAALELTLDELSEAARLEGASEARGQGDAGVFAVQALRTELDLVAVQVPDRRLDVVSILDFETARSWDVALACVASLDAARVPRRSPDDPLLSDADRDALADGERALQLPMQRERDVRERRLFLSAVTGARQRLLLSWGNLDAGGSPRACTPYVTELLRHVTPTTLHQATGTCAPWTVTPASEREEVRAHRQRRGSLPAWSDALRTRFSTSVARVSPSTLRAAQSCTLRHVFARVAALKEDDLSFAPRAYAARDDGQWLHAAFETLWRAEGMGTPFPPSEAGAAAVVDQVLEAGGSRAVAADPVQRDSLVRAVRLAMQREAEGRGGYTPWVEWLEGSFGGSGEPVVRFGSGENQVVLHGQVDRVDRHDEDPSRLLVVDVKRGAGGATRSAEAAVEGTDPQLALYALALEALTGHTVEGVEWFAALKRQRASLASPAALAGLRARHEGKGEPVACEGETFEAWKARALDMAQAVVTDVRRGEIVRVSDEVTVCAACPYQRICRPDFEARALRAKKTSWGGK